MGAFKFAKTVIKSLFNKPATLMYPVVEREWQERTRGAIGIDKDACILCGICAKRCPTGAIEVDRKGGNWIIERMQCIQCGYCVQECPKSCLVMEQKYTEPDYEKIRDVVNVKEAKADDAKADGKLVCDKDTCVYCGLCKKACPADALKVDRKQKVWEVDDELCVKCGACVDKCPKKSLSFGEADAAPAGDDNKAESDAAEKLLCDLENCVYCGLCAKNCPLDALKVDRKAKVWEVDEDLCAKCGACVDKCPKKCLSIGADNGADAPEETKQADNEESKAEAAFPELDKEKCVYCGACENECPEEAIKADLDDWKLDKDKCIGCGACVGVCPTEALTI